MGEAAHVYVAINEVTAVMAKAGLGKNRKNAQQGYNFRGIDDVYNVLSGVLAEAKLLILPRVISREAVEKPTKSGGVSTYVIVTVEFDLVSAKDGSKHTICTVGEAMDTADKASNKAQSAAMKYACLMAFQIPTEGDNDADASHPEKSSRPLVKADASPAELNAVIDGYIGQIDKASSTKVLMGIYAAMTDDPRIPEASRTLIKETLTAQRKKLEGKAA